MFSEFHTSTNLLGNKINKYNKKGVECNDECMKL